MTVVEDVADMFADVRAVPRGGAALVAVLDSCRLVDFAVTAAMASLMRLVRS